MKLLSKAEAQRAGERAYQVVNGFAKIRQVQASDALNAAHTVSELYRLLEVVRTQLDGCETPIKTTVDLIDNALARA